MQNKMEKKENHHKNYRDGRNLKSVIFHSNEKNPASDSKLTNISTSVHAGGNLFSPCVPLTLIT